MPVRPKADRDLLSLYVHLCSSRGAAMPAQALREQFGNEIDRLLEIGVTYAGRPQSVVKCSACYEDHTTEVEYNAESRRSWIFCPEAGRVWVAGIELASLHLNTNWLPDQLAGALKIAPRPSRLTLIEGAAWLLGDTVVGSTKVSVALAIGIRDASEIDQLIAGLGRRKLLEVGLVVVAGCQLPEYLEAVSRYTPVPLDELANFDDGSIQVEPAKLSAWIRGFLQGQKRAVKASGGRLSSGQKILVVFEGRRRRGQPYVSKNAEAKAILNEWMSIYADEEQPAHSTIRKHLPEPK